MSLFGSVTSNVALAKTVDEIKNAETLAQKKGAEINQEISTTLDQVNAKYQELTKLKTDVKKAQATIVETSQDVATTKESISKRKAVVGERMKTLQLSDVNASMMQTILNSENLSDFINRVYAVSVMQSAERSKVEALVADQEKLVRLQAKLEKTKATLAEKQASVQTEATNLDTQVAGLQKKLSDNQVLLTSLAQEKKTEQAKIVQAAAAQAAAKKKAEAQEAAQKQAAAKAQQEASAKAAAATSSSAASTPSSSSSSTSSASQDTSSSATSSSDTTGSSSDNSSSGDQNSQKPSAGAQAGQATAYVATGNATASGAMPQVHHTIAVDTAKIPMGSVVFISVPGKPAYSGYYVAEDTGGAINGNIIDIFVGSTPEANDFGRQAITFTVQ